MKSFWNTLKILAAAFVGIFLINMLVMHVFFNTDVFNPVKSSELEASLSRIRFEPEDAAASRLVQDDAEVEGTGLNPQEYSPAEISETEIFEEFNEEPETGAGEPDSTFFMTTGEVGFLGNLTMLEKLEALTLISKVGRKEADKIYDVAMDGITYSEMRDIEAILKRYLDTDEMKKLMELLEKNKERYSVTNE